MLDYLQTLDDTTRAWFTIGSTVFIAVLITACVALAARYLIHQVANRASASRTLWDDALVFALGLPVQVIIWTVGLVAAAEATATVTETELFELVYPARDIIIIFCLAWCGLRFITSVERQVFNHPEKSKKLDRTTISAIAKLLRVTVIISALLIMMQTLGFSISGVLAFGGIGGMAVGFAAKDMLANFFGALMIYLDKPFKVGDWIRSPDREIEGTVEEIGWRQTRIRTFDKRPLYVPNSAFSTIIVENPSRMTNRRIFETIGVRYDDMAQVHAITQAVETMLRNHEAIDTNLTLMVHLNQFNASSVDFFIYTFTQTTDWVTFHGIKQEILLTIATIIDDHDAEIAFPTRTVHVPEFAGIAPHLEDVVLPQPSTGDN